MLGKILSSGGLIRAGAKMLGINMPGWADSAIGIASDTFGGRDDDSSTGGGGGYTRAVDLGASSMGTEKMVGPGEQKASAAVEYQDELREILSAVNLYARSE